MKPFWTAHYICQVSRFSQHITSLNRQGKQERSGNCTNVTSLKKCCVFLLTAWVFLVHSDATHYNSWEIISQTQRNTTWTFSLPIWGTLIKLTTLVKYLWNRDTDTLDYFYTTAETELQSHPTCSIDLITAWFILFQPTNENLKQLSQVQSGADWGIVPGYYII